MSDVRTPQHRARHTASVLLIVFVAILTPLVVTAGWAVTTVTDTNRFVSTMSALGTNPTVTNYVAAEAASTIVTETDLQHRLEQRLGSAGALLAPVIVQAVQTQLTKALSAVLSSHQFQSLWIDKIRLLHEAFVTAMTTNESKVQQASKLALDVTPQLLAAINQLDAKGYHQLDFARPYLQGDKHLLVTLAEGKQFKEVQGYFHLATTLRWVLWVATLLLAIAAVLIDHRRRRAGFWLGISVACSCVVMLALLQIGKQYATSHAPTPPAVADAIFSTLTSWLRWELRVLVLIGLLAALVLWVTGPTKHARSLRGVFARGGGKATHAVESHLSTGTTERFESDGTTVVDWVASYATVLAWFGVVVGALVLVVWENSFIGAILTILLVVAWFAAIMGIRRRVRASAPSADAPAVAPGSSSAPGAGSGQPPAAAS